MEIGAEWLVDAEGCQPGLLGDINAIRTVCDRIIADLDLHVIDEPIGHKFPPPGGITLLFLLMESHLACHTYPESGIATLNLYCCRMRPDWPWAERLGQMLGATRVRVRFARRGAEGEWAEETGYTCLPRAGGEPGVSPRNR